ncbi:MAG: ATP-binding protein [Bacteroidota bacterium]
MPRNNKTVQMVRITSKLASSNQEKEKCADELVIANKQLVLDRREKAKQAGELMIANKELLFQGAEKELMATELTDANKELVVQNREKEIQAAELHVAMMELKESEKRYSDLFHLSPMPRWVYDPKTSRCLQVNEAAIETYGYSEEEFLTMNIHHLEQDKNGMEKKKSAKSPGENSNVHGCRQRHYKKSGTPVEMEVYSNPILINDVKYMSVAAIDITEKLLHDYKITRAIIKTQEDDRYEIGAELHDNICQILASSLMSFRLLKKSLKPSGIELFNRSQDNILLASAEIRNLSHRLAPAFFADSSMNDAFQRVLNEFNSSHQYKLSLDFDGAIAETKIDMDLQLTLYRILQEQLSNILKHAKASTIHVRVFIAGQKLTMQVTDNGIGFTVKDAMSGIGISNMKRRAELYMGKLTIHSEKEKGCEITVEIPLTEGNRMRELT